MPAHILGMTALEVARESARRRNGEFGTQVKDSTGMELSTATAPDFIAHDAGGIGLLEGDEVRKVGKSEWEAATWIVEGVEADGRLIAVNPNGQRRRLNPADHDLVRPDPERPDGDNARLHNQSALEELRDAWADRDPDYSRQCQEIIDDLPVRAAGPSYRTRMLELSPEQRLEVIEGGQPALYFSLTSPHNGWSHEDALTAVIGHAALSSRPPTREQFDAMDDDELNQHRLVWGIRPSDETRHLVNKVHLTRTLRRQFEESNCGDFGEFVSQQVVADPPNRLSRLNPGRDVRQDRHWQAALAELDVVEQGEVGDRTISDRTAAVLALGYPENGLAAAVASGQPISREFAIRQLRHERVERMAEHLRAGRTVPENREENRVNEALQRWVQYAPAPGVF